MGWKDLFKSRTGRSAPDPRVRWFGKLPTYGDYHSSPTEQDWTVEFHDWLLQGFAAFRNRLSERTARRARLPLAGWVIRLPKSGMTVFSSVADYGGDSQGRPFPLCLYVGLPTSSWPGPTSGTLVEGLRILDGLVGLHGEVARFLNSPGSIESVFADRELDLSRVSDQAENGSWMRNARKVTLADWFAGAATALKIKDPAAWFRVAAEWGDHIAKLESEAFEATLRLPLSASVSVEVQTAGWLRWLESRMNLRRRVLSLAIVGDLRREAGHMNVIARAIVPDDFLLATPVSETLSYVDDLSRAGTDAEGEEGPGLQGASAASAACWIDFVEGRVGAA